METINEEDTNNKKDNTVNSSDEYMVSDTDSNTEYQSQNPTSGETPDTNTSERISTGTDEDEPQVEVETFDNDPETDVTLNTNPQPNPDEPQISTEEEGQQNEDEWEESSYEETEEDIITREYIQLSDLPNPPRRIPRQHVKDFVATVERVSKKFLERKNLRTLFDILRLLKTVFDPFLTKRKTSLVREALRLYPQVELPDPTATGRRRRIPQSLNTQEEKVKRAESYLQDGFLGKAMRMLTSTKVPVPITTEVFMHLQSLYPEQDLDEGKVHYDAIPDKPDKDDIMRSLKKVNLDASGGPSGWNYRHLKVATRSKSFVEFLTVYSGMMATNEAPGRKIMTIADGIALAEPNEQNHNKIRPISMGEVIYKLCAITAGKKNREPGDLLPNQLGSGTPGGVEPLIKIQKDFFFEDDMDPEDLDIVDRSNAFNTLKIKKIRKGLSNHNPKNGPLFEFCYGSPNIILIKECKKGFKIQIITYCLRQGDPNSTYWFQVGDREDLEELIDRLGHDSMVWSYVDDVYVFNKKPDEDEEHEEPDPPPDPDPDRESPLEMIMNTLENVNTNKTKRITKKQVMDHGYETLGGFIGTRTKRLQHLTKELYKLKALIKSLDPLQRQSQLLLLRQCVIPTLNHTMRNVDPRGCEQIYISMKKMIATKISKLAEAPIRLDPRHKRRTHTPSRGYPNIDLVGLPVRYGGLGMGDQELQSRIAWGASQAKTKWLINKWQGQSTRPPRSQKQRMEQHWIQASNELMRSLYRPQAVRISMNAEKSASSWLTTVPMTQSMELTNDEVKRGLRSRLLYTDDVINETKRGKMKKTIIDEFKAAEYEATQTTTSTKHSTPDDPNTWLPDSVVDPMAISVQTYNVESVNTPNPPNNTKNILKYYQKKVHEAVTKLQIRRVRSRYYEGYTYFPMFVSKTGAFLGRTKEWIKQLKQRARLNKSPSPVTQLVSVQSIKSLR